MDERTQKRRAFIINTAYIAVIVAIVYLALEYLLPWIMPFVIGYLIALVLKPVVFGIVKKTGLNSKAVGLVVLLVAYALIVLLLTLGGVKLFSLARSLFTGLPSYFADRIQPAILEVDAFLRSLTMRFLPELADGSGEIVAGILQNLQGSLLSLSSRALSGLASFTTKVPNILLTFLFTIMSSAVIIMNYREVSSFIARQVPQKYRQLFFTVKDSAGVTVLRYLKAYVILMVITFAELSAGLLLLRVDYAIPIALGIAIFDMLPVLGTGGILIPWAAISLMRMDFALALGLLLLYGVVALIRNILEPRVVGTTLGLHPLVTLVAIYVGFQWKGVIGMIVFPIAVQILAGLHKGGVIRLWR